MNEDRHRLIDELKEMKNQARQFETQRDAAYDAIKQLKAALVAKDELFANQRMEAQKVQDAHNAQVQELRVKIRD